MKGGQHNLPNHTAQKYLQGKLSFSKDTRLFAFKQSKTCWTLTDVDVARVPTCISSFSSISKLVVRQIATFLCRQFSDPSLLMTTFCLQLLIGRIRFFFRRKLCSYTNSSRMLPGLDAPPPFGLLEGVADCELCSLLDGSALPLFFLLSF